MEMVTYWLMLQEEGAQKMEVQMAYHTFYSADVLLVRS